MLFLLSRAPLLYIWGLPILNVVRHVSGILAGRSGRKPFELCTDGDLLSIIEAIVRQRGSKTFRISKVRGHADDEMVRTGRGACHC